MQRKATLSFGYLNYFADYVYNYAKPTQIPIHE